jgi:transcription antitermination factor NusG
MQNSSCLLSVDEKNPPAYTALQWYGLRTRSNYEKTSSRVLEGKGYEQYLPLYRSERSWSDRIVEVEQPLFPGYIFCRFEARQRLPILTTPGIVSIIGFGKEPAAVPDAEIEGIRAILRSGLPIEACAYLREGERVRIRRGSLEGVEGVLMRKKKDWRMVISVTILQRSVSVEVDREWVTKA